MTDRATLIALSAALEAPTFRELPLRLSARLAKGRSTVGRLRDLAPGDLVPLTTLVGEPARLLAGGVPIGSGEIVEVGGNLALRLSELGEPGSGAEER